MKYLRPSVDSACSHAIGRRGCRSADIEGYPQGIHPSATIAACHQINDYAHLRREKWAFEANSRRYINEKARKIGPFPE